MRKEFLFQPDLPMIGGIMEENGVDDVDLWQESCHGYSKTTAETFAPTSGAGSRLV